ncbi:Protein RALF-like 36 [Cardamine amara subsp. amara]|uniref:Protein RALF-like 36 n=1 Tax=Cardamine amara subsp. amara TaxID=228776 RepID=A0ABD1AGH9_CARAN
MAVSKKTMVISLALIVMISIVMSTTEGRSIGAGAMEGDRPKGCGPGSPPDCKEKSANPYKRGCEPSQKCRGG